MVRHRARLPPPPPPPGSSEEVTICPADQGALGVGFATRQVQPPAELYVTRDDILFITSANAIAGVNIEIRVRMLISGKPGIQYFAFTHTPASDRSATSSTFTLAEGFILSVSAFCSGSSTFRGATYATVGLAHGDSAAAIISRVLIQDYLTNTGTVSWPGNRLRLPGEGPGWVHSLSGTMPAAGAEWSETVPTGALWRVVSVVSGLHCSAVAQNRQPILQLVFGGNFYYAVEAGFSLQASQFADFSFAEAGILHVTAVQAAVVGMLIRNLMQPTTLMLTFTLNLQVADQWEAPRFLVEEWVVL